MRNCAKTIMGKAQTMVKPRQTACMILLCVLSVLKRIIYYELLPPVQTLNSCLYCKQQVWFYLSIDHKRTKLASMLRSTRFIVSSPIFWSILFWHCKTFWVITNCYQEKILCKSNTRVFLPIRTKTFMKKVLRIY